MTMSTDVFDFVNDALKKPTQSYIVVLRSDGALEMDFAKFLDVAVRTLLDVVNDLDKRLTPTAADQWSCRLIETPLSPTEFPLGSLGEILILCTKPETL